MHSSPSPSRAALGLTLVLAAASLLPVPAGAASDPGDPPELWPPAQREFFLDGPAWLLPEERREALAEMDEDERRAAIDSFLAAEEIPGVDPAELQEAIRRRRALMRSGFLSPTDVRARLLFLHGAPAERLVIDCGDTFVPLEVWAYEIPDAPAGAGPEEARDELVVYRPGAGLPWKLWDPYDSKRALYTSQMEYFLEQWEESNGRLFSAVRFDLQSCEETRRVDRATGVRALRLYDRDRPDAEDFLRYLEPPADLARWVNVAVETPVGDAPEPLDARSLDVEFPERRGQRIEVRHHLRVVGAGELPTAPAESGADGEEEIRLVVEGVIEEGGSVFEGFRVRFVLPPPPDGQPAVLVFGEALRPGQEYLVRFRVRDEVGGRSAYRVQAFRVPDEPRPVETPPVPEEAIVALGEALQEQRMAGEDSLVLVPPTGDVVLGHWRAEAIVTGERIRKVAFSVDGDVQLTVNRAPYSAELRLARFPKEQVVRAEGVDGDGEVVDADEVVLNQPRGALAVRITEPGPGVAITEGTEVVAQVIVPEGRRVEEVLFEVDGEVVTRLERPPWRARVDPPGGTELSYLSVRAVLDDERSAEDVRILNAPDFVEQVDVDLVELYAAVTDRSGRPAKGLEAEDFEVRIGGEPAEIARFQPVEDLPLTVGITLDTSGSMASSLVEAQEAARGFLSNVIAVRDHAFAVGFSDQPILLMPPTTDIDAVADSIGSLRAVGWTALHDAVVTALYYFRGFPGQRVLVLLSDGDDTRSSYAYRDVLEFARRGGVAVYSVGLGVSTFGGARKKLSELAEETGGRSFFIGQAEELRTVYAEIEEELRSRYLLAVSPASSSEEGYREVEVRVDGRGREVRTQRGVYW